LFAWLRPIAELVVQADERPLSADETDAYAAQVLALLQQEGGCEDFRREYHRSLQELPDVVIAHSTVVKLAAKSEKRGQA